MRNRLFLLLWILTPIAADAAGLAIVPAATLAKYRGLMPQFDDARLTAIVNDPATVFYDSQAIVPAYQDSFGDPVGMRPNTIDPSLINLAVPGGWQRLFERKGRFNFPFATGGADRSPNFAHFNFFWLPSVNGKAQPVAYWKLNFGRWRWMFPKGSYIGEVMMVQFPDGDLRVFEVRLRRRELDKWVNTVFRPFPSADDLAYAIRVRRPDWARKPALYRMMSYLTDPETLTTRTLETKSFPGTFEKVTGHVDVLPDFQDPMLVKDLLSSSQFRSVGTTVWKEDRGTETFAASTKSSASIVPTDYDAGVLPLNEVSCRRCHTDAGRQIQDWHPDMVLYGELWGEDETFSWHPFENSMFVNSQGGVVNFNNDNRRLRQDFVKAGVVAPYNAGTHPATSYKELPRSWRYDPIRSVSDYEKR